MPLRFCDWDSCTRPAFQGPGDCIGCDRHLCQTHLRCKLHDCPRLDGDLAAYDVQWAAAEGRKIPQLMKRINKAALCARASSLRGGIDCNADLSRNALAGMMGGQNCHAIITFSDGVEWMARFRIDAVKSPPPEVQVYVLRSEVATMEFLASRTKIPVPRVYDWSCAKDADGVDGVGVGYILMEKIDGKPFDWNAATEAQKQKVMEQLVDIFIELERHPFDKLGSLMPVSEGSNPDIQGLSTSRLYRPNSGGTFGPFFSSREEAEKTVNYCLDMVASGEMGIHNPVDEYLMRLYRLEVLDRLLDGRETDEKFYLKHPDEKGDHILVNSDFDIVGIIDWEWARTVSYRDAFSAPCMMWPVGEFYEGKNEVSKDEECFARLLENRGRPGMANCVLEGRHLQRFWFNLLPQPYGSSWEDTVTLFQGLRSAFGDETTWNDWKQDALVKHGADKRLTKLIAQRDMSSRP
ncbi:hypothetical protein F5B20DRAFT_364631 [Whalleya microplaca]|nr:hypothetical protein F5B20DRAFT_364631 [Whalleya microplaca]